MLSNVESKKTTQGAKLCEVYTTMYIGEGNIYIYIYLHMHKILLGVYLKTDSIVCFQNKELDGGGME